MEYNIFFDICAVCVTAIILITFYCRKTISSFKTKVFEVLVWVNGLAAFTDIITVLPSTNDRSLTFKWLINMAYYVTHSATSFLVVSYFVVMAEPIVRMSTSRKLQLIVPYALQVALIAFNPMLRLLFYFDENGNYLRGQYQWIVYVISTYYVIYLMIYFIRHVDLFDKYVRVFVTGFIVVLIMPVTLEYFYPEFLVECFAATLFVMAVFILYQTEDDSVDATTKLLSYQAFENDCRAYISSGMNFSFLMIKLRDAKYISDMFGNQFFAKVCTAFANYISQYVRYGNAYSLGSGVFGLCFVNESADPKNVMDNITARMKEPWGFEEMTTRLSASMSILSYPLHAADYDAYMELADSIFYRSGSKPSTIYADDVTVKDRRRKLGIERTLSSEDISKKIEIFFQPIYSAKEKKFVGVEALARLRDSVMGYVMPDEFIMIAEKSGNMIRIGEYIFEAVCRFVAENPLDELGIKYININLSVVQCMQTDLVSVVASILQKYDVNPSKICFEISEHAATDPPEVMINNIKELHRLGLSFALDNYGKGQSGLQQLTVIPLRFIKFDSSFIRRAFASERERTLLQSSINMSKSINLSVIAQGVENEQMAQQLQEFSFDYCQGYNYAPVCKSEDIIQTLHGFIEAQER